MVSWKLSVCTHVSTYRRGVACGELLIPKGKGQDVDPSSRIVGGGADRLVVGFTRVVVIVLGARLTPDRSLARKGVCRRPPA
jgi:hypothetical protein